MSGKSILIFALILLSLALGGCGADSQTGSNQPAAATLDNTHTFELVAAGNRPYRIFVYVPDRHNEEDLLPVIYMIDANYYFGTMVESVRSQTLGNPDSAGAIVVGIGYPDNMDSWQERQFDLTNKPESIPVASMFGGDQAFRRFLLEKLKPHIEQRYPVDTGRELLFGHSFGGLFALRTLVTSPEGFDKYFAASPSLWWGEKSLLKRELAELTDTLDARRQAPAIYLTVGELERTITGKDQKPEAEPKVDGNTGPPGFANRSQVKDAELLSTLLAERYALENTLVVIDGEGHISVVPAAIAKAVGFALAQ